MLENVRTSLIYPTAFGAFYSRHVEALVGSTHDVRDPDAVARTCYAAAVIYAVFVAFCGLQVSLGSPLPDLPVHRETDAHGPTKADWIMPQMMVHSRYPRGIQL